MKKIRRINKRRTSFAIIVTITIITIPVLFKLKEVYVYNNKNNLNNESIPSNLSKENIPNNRTNYKDGFYYESLSNDIKEQITGHSFPEKFDNSYQKIEYEDLVYVRVKYYDFDNVLQNDGELIVNKEVAQDIIEIFYKLYQNKYQFTSIKLVEDFNSNDELSMANNNSSAFNYRINEQSTVLSWHAFGLAVDINPLYNPYILGDTIYPSNATEYIDRSKDFIGKIDKNDLCYKLFIEYGWKWGGDFIYSKDYQHFYKDIYDNDIRNKKS